MTKDNLSSEHDGHLGLWAERAMTAANSPEQVDAGELASWLKSEEFTQAYQTVMRTRRALLDDDVSTNTDKAFGLFRQKHEGTRGRVLWLYMAAAACVAALCYLALPRLRSGRPAEQASEAYLYQAVADADTAITLAFAGDTITLHPSPLTPHPSPVKAVAVASNIVQLQPVDYSAYEITPTTISVPQGKVAMLRLPDGTTVWLNAFSSLIYPTDFPKGEPRHVQLKGEAYFAVARDGERPFVVDCDGLQTRVLGTEFNIRSYADNDPCVTLVKGSVEVTTGKGLVLLHPNQSATVNTAGTLSVDSEVDTEPITCWRDNRFYFDGQSLRDIMIEVGRWYNMDVMIGSNSHIADRLHFRGERQWTIQQLVDQINMISNADIRISGNTLTVY